MIPASPPKPSFLAHVLARFQAKMASPTGRLQAKADTPVLPSWHVGSPVAAVPVPECPACGAECEQPLECTICLEPCCPECAPTGTCSDCTAAAATNSGRQKIAPASGRGILQPLRPSPAAVVPLADGPAQRILREAMASNQAAAPASAVPPQPIAAVSPSAIVRPAAAAPTKPVQDRAFFEALEKTVTSNMDRWNVAASLSALDRGEVPAEFIGQAERDEQCLALYLRLKSEESTDEQWRIIKHLDQLEAGGNPGPFLPGSVIASNAAALDAAIAAETDPKELFRLAGQIDAVAQGSPFISREQARAEYAGLEAELEAATTNDERYRIAARMNAAEWID